MYYPFRYPPLGRPDLDPVTASAIASPQDADDPHFDHALAELERLVVDFDRLAADQMRSRRYRRRSNATTPGFRRHQRRGTAS